MASPARENPKAFGGLVLLMLAFPPVWILLAGGVLLGRLLQGVGRVMRS